MLPEDKIKAVVIDEKKAIGRMAFFGTKQKAPCTGLTRKEVKSYLKIL